MNRVVALAALALLLAGACHRGGAKRELVVFAASSLRESFAALATVFERDHPEAHVTLSFAGSQELRLQLEHGAGADVFASADAAQMQRLSARGLVVAPAQFATNELVIAVSDRAAQKVHSLEDLPSVDHIVLGAREVPVGEYALAVLDRADRRFGPDFRQRVERQVVSRELNTRQVLAKVTLGEADAALVYRTDVAAARGKVHAVTIPPELNVVAHYPIAVTRSAEQPELAHDWVRFVLSPEGRHQLAEAGLGAP